MKIEDNGDKPERSKTGDGSYNDARARVANIDERAVYRIGCIAFANRAGDLDSAVSRAFAQCFDGHDGPRLALLPGVVLAASKWPRSDRPIRGLAKRFGVSVLAEVSISARRDYRAYGTTGAPLPVAIAQRFASSKQANKDRALVDDLLAECRLGGERTIDLAGVPVGLLVCGENNLLANGRSFARAECSLAARQRRWGRLSARSSAAGRQMVALEQRFTRWRGRSPARTV